MTHVPRVVLMFIWFPVAVLITASSSFRNSFCMARAAPRRRRSRRPDGMSGSLELMIIE
jgi:hypothetical protein